MKNKNLNIESGRSMVEMLGVLAVIGVLSVAGIAGYTTAMRSYRTNEIVNAASMLYVMAMAQNAGNGPAGKVAYTDIEKTNPSGVSTLEYENNVISITFNDEKDCAMAKNKLGEKATDDCTNKKLTVTLGDTITSQTPSEYTECTTNDNCSGGRICDTYKGICYCADFNESWNGTDCVEDTEIECTSGYYRCFLDESYGWSIKYCENGHWEHKGWEFNCTCLDYLPHPTKEEAATGCGEV